jgi:predicted deacylase
VDRGTILAIVTDPYGNFEKKIKSPISGYVICANESPVVFKGDAIIHIGKGN